MLQKRNRLPLSKTKLSNTISYATPYFVLKVAQNELPLSRLGVIISKKIDKRATVRNSSRRIIYALFAEFLVILPSGYDMLVILKKSLTKEDSERLKELFKTSFTKLHIV